MTFTRRTGKKRGITIERGAEPPSRSTPSPDGPDFIDQSNAGTGASAAVRDGSDGNDGSDDEIHPHSNATHDLPSDHMRHVEKWGETPSQPSLSSQGPDFNDEQAAREERAAIMEEYDGELPNEEAEAQEEA